MRRRWARRGFVPLSPGRVKIRHRILPRSVIGISFMLLSFAVGAAFSGAAFYAYYDNRLAQNEATVSRFVETFDEQFADATSALDDLRVEAIGDIRNELTPLDGMAADATAVVGLPERVGDSVWALETRNSDGALMLGSAFAVAEHRGGTALITSYQLVSASTVEPGPGIDVVKDDLRLNARLWSWDIDRDLALIVVDAVLPTLELAEASAQTAAVGRPVFAMAGVGGRGSTASPGTLLDHGRIGLQHTAAVGALFSGGPLVDGRGRVVGMASIWYRPYGIDHGAVGVAPDVNGLCAQLLQCGERLTEVASESSGVSQAPEILADTGEAPAEGAEPEATEGGG